jgi:hypothetical protein
MEVMQAPGYPGTTDRTADDTLSSAIARRQMSTLNTHDGAGRRLAGRAFPLPL